MTRAQLEELAAAAGDTTFADVCALALAGDAVALCECRLARRAAYLASEAAYSSFAAGDPSPWAEYDAEDADADRDAAASAAETLAWFRGLDPDAGARAAREIAEDAAWKSR